MTTTQTDQGRRAVTFETLVAGAAAMAAIAASVIHLDAAGDHTEHAHVVVFFIAVAALQLGFGAAAFRNTSRRLLLAGIALNLGVAAVWVFSRTTGLRGIPDVATVEDVGLKDAIATFFELGAAGAAALLVVMPAAAKQVLVVSGQRALGAMAAATFALAVPGMLVAHGHAGGHSHGDGELAVAHSHDETATATGEHAADGHSHDATTANGHTADGHAHDATTTADGHTADGHAHDASTTAAATTAATDAAHAHDDAAHDASTAAAGHDHADTGEVAQASETFAAPPQPEPRGIKKTVRWPLVLMPRWLGGEDHKNLILPLPETPCANCYLTSLAPDLVFADGSSANLDRGVMLHHAVVSQPFRDDKTCSRRQALGWLGERFFAAGNERTAGALPDGYGYLVDPGPWLGVFEIMNHTDNFQVVFFQMTVTYLPATDTSIKPVTPLWLDVNNCGDSQFAVDQGRTTTRWEWVSNVTGRMVFAAGHVHDGGLGIELKNLTTGEPYCNSLAGYGSKPAFLGTIDTMTACSWDRLGSIREGQTIALDAIYDTPRPLPDVMGIVIAFVYETNDVVGGSARPAAMTPSVDGVTAPVPGGGHSH